MKKDKTSDKPAADFKNSPFRSLKGLAPHPAPQQPGAAPSVPAPKNQTEDDGALFLRAMAGAKKLDQTDEAPFPGARPDKTAGTVPADDAEEQLRFLEAMKKMGPVIRAARQEELEEGQQRRSASSRMRQLKRGTIKITEELDLHGFMKDEALVRLDRFIASAFGRGQKAVLVITGKGINSPEGPVLQGAVAAWLREKGKGPVAEFAPAPRDRGGSGAFVVFLKSG